MANREAKIKFTADTKDLNSKIKSTNSIMSAQRAELKLNEAQFKNTGNEAEYLKNKQKILSTQLVASQDKIKALSSKLELAKKIYGENSNEVVAFQRQLTGAMTEEERLKFSISQCNIELKQHAEASEKAETATEQLNNKISQQETKLAQLKGEYTEAILKYGKTSTEAKQLANEIEDLSGKLKNNKTSLETAEKAADDLENSFDKVEKSGGKVKNTLLKIGGTVGKTAAAGIAAISAASVGAGKALADMTTNGSEYADNVLTESTVTGIATDKLQEYQYAAELVDVSVETLTRSMAKNIKSMKNAQDGSKGYVEAYKTLGVSVIDANGNLRDSDTVYWELIDSLGKVENETERDALAMTILGKSAQDLNPLIEAGAEKMGLLGQQARDAGYVMDEETLQSYGVLNDQMQRLNVGATAAKNALGSLLLPVLTELSTNGVGMLGNFTNTLLNANGDMSVIGNAIGDFASTSIKSLVGYLPNILSLVVVLVTSIVTTIASSMPEIARGIVECLPALISGVQELILSLVEALPALIQTIVTALPTLISALIDAFVNVIVTICGQFSNIISPIIEALPDIIVSIVTALVKNLPALISGLISLVLGIVEATPKIILGLIEALPTIISLIIEGLLSAIPQIILGLIQLVCALVVALPQIFMALIQGIINIFVGIWDGIKNTFSGFGDFFGSLWQIICDVFSGVFNWWKDNIYTPIITVVKICVDAVVGFFQGAWNGICVAFSAVGEFFGSVWDSIVNCFSGAVNFFKGIFEGIWNGIKWVINNVFIGGIEGFINIIIDGINGLLGLVNGAVSGLGSLIGQDWNIGLHINKVSLPRLYNGGIAFGLTPALVGDYPSAATNPEVIAPLDKLNSMISDNIETAVNNNVNQSAIDYDLLAEKMVYAVSRMNIEMKLDKRTVGRVVRGVT